jgi:hypothetical protein
MIVQRLVDAWQSFPYLIIVLSLLAVLGPGLLNTIVALSILSAAAASRVIRGATLAVVVNPYVEAGRAMGCGHLRIMARHILPNVAPTIIILATIALGGVILAESALSFLGYGVPPPHPSWGAMLSGSGRTYMYKAPWMAISAWRSRWRCSASTCWATRSGTCSIRGCAVNRALRDHKPRGRDAVGAGAPGQLTRRGQCISRTGHWDSASARSDAPPGSARPRAPPCTPCRRRSPPGGR